MGSNVLRGQRGYRLRNTHWLESMVMVDWGRIGSLEQWDGIQITADCSIRGQPFHKEFSRKKE